MDKLFSNGKTCILSPGYFKSVAETASLFTKLPYDTKYYKEAWYWKNLRKRKGYLLTGFKVDYPGNSLDLSKTVRELSPSSDLPDFLDALNKAPLEMIFVDEDLFNRIKSIKSDACLLETSEYGAVKSKPNNYHITSHFCIKASSFMKELSSQEILKIKSIDNFVAGIR